jgi:riboflavin biosynthesis pyrimidine reductase
MIEPISGLALKMGVSEVADLADCYGNWSGIRTNHVMTKTGQMVDQLGSSRGISTAEDRALLIALRKLSQVVIVDAKTARIEQYRSLAQDLVIVSQSSDFGSIPAVSDGTNVFLASPARSLASNTASNHIEIDINDPFEAILLWADASGFSKLLLEAGPKLSKLAFEAKRVSQSALTITPQLSEVEFSEIRHPFDEGARVLSVARAKGASFSLWSH